MSDTLANLRKLIDLEIIAETSLTLTSAEIYALRELFAEVERLRAVVAEYADRGNWSSFSIFYEYPSDSNNRWLLDKHGYTRAENALKDGE